MPETTIKYWLVVDHRKEKVRARKTKPKRSDLGTNEMLVRGEVNVHEPEVDIPETATELNVPESRVRRALADGLDEADIPDWFDTVDEVFHEHQDLVERGRTDELLGKVLLADPGSPDPEEVRDEIWQRLQDRAEQGEV